MKRLIILAIILLASECWGATIDYYVRGSDGNDTDCNGLAYASVASAPACAKKTIYGAIKQVVTDLHGVTANSATINIQPATYQETHNLILSAGTGVVLKNNVVSSSDNYELCVTTDSTSGFVSDSNVFYRASGKPIYWGGTFAAATGPSSGTEYTVTEFTATGNDIDSVSGNPLFISANDFHLRAGSSAIDAGNSTISDASYIDYGGSDQRGGNGLWEIGAYVFPPYAFHGLGTGTKHTIGGSGPAVTLY